MTVTRIDYIEHEARYEIPENATATAPPSDEAIQTEVTRVVRRADDLMEDLALAVVVRTRLTEDKGNRVPLETFIRQEGFDPADFGVE